MTGDNGDAETLTAIRSFLLGIIGLVLFGLELELLFLNHVKTPLQMLPVGLAGGGLGMIVWHLVSPNPASIRILKGILCACSIVGALGMLIHNGMNAENHWRESHGLRPGFEEDAPPSAPAAMLPLGLLGLAYTFRHPALDERFGDNFQSITTRYLWL